MSSVVQLLRSESIDLHISVSAIRSLEGCTRLWWYRYAAGAPPEDTPARLVLGGALHKAMASFYQALQHNAPEPSLSNLLGVAGSAIARAVAADPPILFPDGEGPESLMLEAERLLRAFLEQGYRPARVVAVEEPFALELVHPETGELLPFEERMAGAIDLVAEGPDGSLEIIDHKISSRLDRSKTSRPDLQMAVYAWAAREMFGVEDVALLFQSVIRTKVPKVIVQHINRVPHDEAEGMESTASALTLIHAAVGHPDGKRLMGRRRSWRCADCSWRRRCGSDRE